MKKLRFIQYKRKRLGLTNYRKRLTLLISGIPRLVVRRSNKNILVQIVEYSDVGDKVIVSVKSDILRKHGWNLSTSNLPAAYLTGYIAGKKALSKKMSKAIADMGLQTPSKGSRIYAAIKGVIDAGLNVPCSEEVFPPIDRIRGKHISNYKKNDIDKKFDTTLASLK